MNIRCSVQQSFRYIYLRGVFLVGWSTSGLKIWILSIVFFRKTMFLQLVAKMSGWIIGWIVEEVDNNDFQHCNWREVTLAKFLSFLFQSCMLWFLCYPLLVVMSWIFYEYLRYKVCTGMHIKQQLSCFCSERHPAEQITLRYQVNLWVNGMISSLWSL